MLFPEFVEEKDPRFIFASQVEEFFKDQAQAFAMFYLLKLESKMVFNDLLIVCEFPYEFPYDIIDLPLERKVEFSIGLVPHTRHVSMAP